MYGYKRKVKILFLVQFIALSIIGCKKEFLDKQPYDQPTEKQLFGSISGLNTAVVSLYGLSTASKSLGVYNQLIADLMGEDATIVSSGNFHKFTSPYRYNFNVNGSYGYDLWSGPYTLIANCNNVLAHIDAVPISSTIDKENIDYIKGQVYALRALAYFDLVRFFGETAYTLDSGGRGVPIVSQNETDFDIYNRKRSTIKEVYDFIVSDLELSKPLMISNSFKGYMDIYAVYAMSARVHSAMGEWETAKADATKVIVDGGFNLMNEEEYLSGFNSVNGETIFNQSFVDFNTLNFHSLPSFTYHAGDAFVTDGNADGVIDSKDIALGSFYDSPDNPSNDAGYGSLRVTRNFIDLFSDTDFRKKQFATYRSSLDNSPVDASPGNPYRQIGSGYLSIKYQNRNSSILGSGDYPKIRISEMYLIKAEAEYELGDQNSAAATLFILQGNRDGSLTSASTHSGILLRDEIRDERRKELVFEGHRMFDLKRWDLDLDRTESKDDQFSDFSTLGSGTVGKYIILKNSVSKRFCLPIPIYEINANTALTNADQNSVF